jgi:hypothetical protein
MMHKILNLTTNFNLNISSPSAIAKLFPCCTQFLKQHQKLFEPFLQNDKAPYASLVKLGKTKE